MAISDDQAIRAVQLQVGAGLAFAVVTGAFAWLIAHFLSLPAPGLFGLLAGLAIMVPDLGTTLGWLPLVLFGFAVAPLWKVMLAVAAAVLVRFVELRWRRVLDERSVFVGPAVVVLAAALGYALDGLGGLLVVVVVAIFGVAWADALADEIVSPSDSSSRNAIDGEQPHGV